MSVRLPGVLLLLLVLLPRPAPAQEVQLAGFAGWRFGGSGRDPVSAQEIDIAGAASFGGTASLAVSERNAVELYFSHAGSEATSFFTQERTDVDLSYLHLGLVHELDDEGLRPFLAIALGGARLQQTGGEARTRFSVGAGLGARVFPTRSVGFRAEARLLFFFDERGSGSSVGSPTGGGFVVQADTIIQAELAAGLVLRF